MITVRHAQGDEWLVTVTAAITTEHRVRLSKKEHEQLSAGKSSEELIEESFRFLLERETNTSILSSFELPLIGRYFPEYEDEIRRRLGKPNR